MSEDRVPLGPGGPKGPSTSPKPSWRAKLLLCVGTLLATALAGEVALRFYHKATRGTPLFSLIPRYRDTRFPLSPFLVFGPRVDWQIEGKQNSEQAYFNHQGFRHPGPIGPKQPGEFRIITFGGSTTEDVWNDEGIHWPLILEQELRAQGYDRVHVFNAAMSAYTTAHSLVRFAFDAVEYDPDLVLVMHNINDLTVNYFAARDGRTIDPNYAVKYSREIFTGDIDDDDVIVSRLLNSIVVRLRALGRRPAPVVLGPYDLSAGLRLFERNLRHMILLARANGSRIVLLTEPIRRSRAMFEHTLDEAADGHLGPVPTYDQLVADFETYNRAILEVAAREGVPAVDMDALLPQDDDYFADCVHYTSAGVRAFGEILASRLPATGALDSPGSGGADPVVANFD